MTGIYLNAGRRADLRPLMASTTIRHILVRHEQGAGHAAEGYALATGKTGCAGHLRTRSHGVLRPLGDAMADSVPSS